MRRGVLLLAMLFAFVAPTMPASASTAITASITSLTPALPSAGSTVDLAVQISNPTAHALEDLSATFMVSTAPLVGRSQIPAALSGTWLPYYRTIGSPVASGLNLASGASTVLTLTTTMHDIALANSRPGVYLFGVSLQGTSNGSSVRLHPTTLLPWAPSASAARLNVMTVWTLTAPPARGVDGILLNDALSKSLLAGGRLREQLNAMAQVPDALWLVDPLLIESVRAIADGARLRSANGDVRATTDAESQAAKDWLQQLVAATASGTLAAMPVGDFDVRAALKFGRNTLIRSAVGDAPRRLASALQTASTPPLAVPIYGGPITTSAWQLLSHLGASIAVTSDLGYPATQTTYTPTSALDVRGFSGRVLVADHVIANAPVQSDPLQSRQQFAAELLMTSLERPNDGRVITVAVDPAWRPSKDSTVARILDAPWITRVNVAAAGQAGSGARGFDQNPATTQQRSHDVAVGNAVDTQRELGLLTSDPTFASDIAGAVQGILSRWWTARLADDWYTPAIVNGLDDFAASVRVVTHGDIVFGGETGRVPVTIANGLPVPVDISLIATGIPSARVQIRQRSDVHLNAGKRVSVELPTRVTGSGDSYVMLQLVTAHDRNISLPVLLTVRSAAYARVASYLVAFAFAALLLLVAVNTMRRIRLRRAGITEDE